MLFLFRRVKENFFVFLLMGILYHYAYKFVQIPNAPATIPISLAGFLIVAMFAYVYFLHLYLTNVEYINSYLITNSTAYGIYVIFYYVVYALSAFDVWFFRSFYSTVFKPYRFFEAIGTGHLTSTIIVHLVFMAAIFILPFFVRDNSVSMVDDYLNNAD